MRIALCYSGLLRNFEECVDTHKKYLFDTINPDIFIHTWSKIGSKASPRWYNNNYSVDQHIQEINEQNNIDLKNLLDIYQPKKIFIEYPNIKYFYTKFYYANNTKFFNNVMMHYSVNKSNNLKKQFEQENDFIYDMVIRCRFDLYFEHMNLLDGKIENNTIYLAPNENIDHPFDEQMRDEAKRIGPSYMPNDQFAYSTSSGMDYYCSVYDIYKENFDFFVKHPEGVLSEHLWLKNTSTYKHIAINDSIKMKIQSRYWK